MSAQTLWDIAALAGAIFACGFTLMRRHMLSDYNHGFPTAPGHVQFALSAQALVIGAVGVSLATGGHHASQVETLLLVVSGAVSTILVVNLDRLGRKTEPQT